MTDNEKAIDAARKAREMAERMESIHRLPGSAELLRELACDIDSMSDAIDSLKGELASARAERLSLAYALNDWSALDAHEMADAIAIAEEVIEEAEKASQRVSP